MSLKVGIVGLGIMGGSFAKNLRDANFEVCGFDILDDNIKKLVSLGGKAGSSPRDVANQSDVVITSLPSIAAFHEVMSGKDGLKDAKKDGLIIIECSTLPIDEKQAAHDTLAEIGSILMDCPISGTGAQAINKDLSIYVSGEEATVR